MAKLNECLIVWEDAKGFWGAMGFDGVMVEGHSGENIVTSYPVSKGFRVSDHTIRQNAKVKLDTVISNVSMSVATVRQSFEAAFTALVVAAGGERDFPLSAADRYGRVKYDNNEFDLGVANALTAQVSLDKVNEAFEKIKELTRTGQLVHIMTMRGMYLDCVLKTYDSESDVTNAYSLPIILNLEQLVVLGEGDTGVAGSALSDIDGDILENDLGGLLS